MRKKKVRGKLKKYEENSVRLEKAENRKCVMIEARQEKRIEVRDRKSMYTGREKARWDKGKENKVTFTKSRKGLTCTLLE